MGKFILIAILLHAGLLLIPISLPEKPEIVITLEVPTSHQAEMILNQEKDIGRDLERILMDLHCRRSARGM